MNSYTNIKIKSVIILGIVFILSAIIATNLNSNARNSLEYDDIEALNNEGLKISLISDRIFINGTSDWVDFKNTGNCTGQGTYSDPYIIEDLVINGEYLGNCIWIENSDVYFKIENCTGKNAGNYGIYLHNVSNGHLINNTFSFNLAEGISLYRSHNNTVSGTKTHDNFNGIRLYESNDNIISGNQVTGNYFFGIGISNSNNTKLIGNTIDRNSIGIDLWKSNNSIVSGNNMNECGLRMSGNFEILSSNNIDTSNTVNGKRLYYYINEIGLNSSNFTNAGQVILVNCNESLISDLDISHSSYGISLYYSNKNNISGNTANNNRYGIRLDVSNNNTIAGNTANDNFYNGIDLRESNNNTISENRADRNSVGIEIWKCNNTLISRNIGSGNSFYGIFLVLSNNNTISGNTANNNMIGILLDRSNYNTVKGNTLIENDDCIIEDDSEGNILENNDCGETQAIIGYDLLYLLGTICLVTMILLKKIKQPKK